MFSNNTSSVCQTKIVSLNNNQKKYWVEIKLVDELNKPIAGISWYAENESTRCGHNKIYKGKSDKDGIITIKNLHKLELSLFLDAQEFADEMEKRQLRLNRYDEGSTIKYDTDKSHIYHYAKIGELCNQAPVIKNWNDDKLPFYHFPNGKKFDGYKISDQQLDKRHIIEICPFRAWLLILHHIPEYSLVNAYNLAVMSDLAYLEKPDLIKFFNRDFQDLSTIPQLTKSKSMPYTVVNDVPFSERYYPPVFMDTAKAETPVGNTQLFYIESKGHIIISWRGTWEAPDWLTDINYIPSSCPKEIASEGKMHGGFLEAYNISKVSFEDEFKDINDKLRGKKLFVCGHSLGGALGLAYAAEMTNYKPLLYTYGMPRIFSAKAIQTMTGFVHYRHVNDSDTVTSVPPDADLDNWLYGKFGYLGNTFGFIWAGLVQLPLDKIGAISGDPFWHHGELVCFFKISQHIEYLVCHDYTLQLYCRRQTSPLPYKVKLFLVPSLAKLDNEQARANQEALMEEYSLDDYENLFPSNTNPLLDSFTNPMNHSMSGMYVPYINNELLEASWPELELQRKLNRQKFKEQIQQYTNRNDTDQTRIPPKRVARDKCFLDMQESVAITLNITKSIPGGENALIRFRSKAMEEYEPL
ncbi:lipase family protein [Proteus terrae]|uniref:lipase family protein n=1 Tax=Proteus terrae TaxID=1574161 RepID=UPI002246A73B|nr:lipase family protein [Proteus terrae]MCW9689298.1 lipase family protein [Proteus terrae]